VAGRRVVTLDDQPDLGGRGLEGQQGDTKGCRCAWPEIVARGPTVRSSRWASTRCRSGASLPVCGLSGSLRIEYGWHGAERLVRRLGVPPPAYVRIGRGDQGPATDTLKEIFPRLVKRMSATPK
jgi:hypothetical protein